jgi:acyl carrier protein
MAMSRNEIKEKLMDVMRMAVPSGTVNLENLTEASELVTDIGLSSVGVLYIVIAIEEFFGIRFDDVGFADFKTIGDVIDYIEKKCE